MGCRPALGGARADQLTRLFVGCCGCAGGPEIIGVERSPGRLDGARLWGNVANLLEHHPKIRPDWARPVIGWLAERLFRPLDAPFRSADPKYIIYVPKQSREFSNTPESGQLGWRAVPAKIPPISRLNVARHERSRVDEEPHENL